MDILSDIFLYVLHKVHKNKNMEKKPTDEQSLLFEATILWLQESEI